MKKLLLLLLLFLVIILFTFYSEIQSYYYSNEQIKSEKHYKDNKAGHNFTRWYDWENAQNQIWRELNYIDGEPHGKVTMWHENGQIESESTWQNGKCISGDCD